MYRYGLFIHRHAKIALVIAALILGASVALGIGAFGKLKGGGFTDPGAESTKAEQLADAEFGGQANLIFLVHAKSGTADTPAVAQAGRRLADGLAQQPYVENVVSYWATKAPGLRSTDGADGLVVAHVDGDDDQAGDRAGDLITRYAVDTPAVTVKAGGGTAAGVDINAQVTTSLIRAESIAVPITTLMLVWVFGSLVAAALPLIIGSVAIMGTFAELFVLGSVTDVSVFAINLTTALGLGLGIDYSLLLVSRFREQLADGDPVDQAVARTVATAGRTVLFAAATVASALAALLVFPQYFLRSFAYAGIGVVVISALSALVLMPALLAVLGTRVNKGKVPFSAATLGSESGFWRRTATAVMSRPVISAIPAVVVLAFLAAPLAHVAFGTPDQGVLPKNTASRQVSDRLTAGFPGQADQITVVTTGAVPKTTLSAYAQKLSALAGVVRVDSSAGSFADGTAAAGAGDQAALTRPDAEQLVVSSGLVSKSSAAEDLVQAIRAVAPPAGVDSLVGGNDADLVDTSHTIGHRLPIGIALIIATTFLLLFLFTGSLVQPIRALLFNTLTLSATLGILVWIFQDGHLASALSFTPRPMDMSMTVLFFCIAFGLSMDYEVFLISRIKELHDRGLPTTEAVSSGLARTGRIVTAAATLLAVSLFGFGASTVSFLQMFGIGSGLAILLDATLIRAVLMPVFLRVVGEANWYCPAPLRRLYGKVALSEA
jgi:RND superfamily putative drug exporter